MWTRRAHGSPRVTSQESSADWSPALFLGGTNPECTCVADGRGRCGREDDFRSFPSAAALARCRFVASSVARLKTPDELANRSSRLPASPCVRPCVRGHHQHTCTPGFAGSDSLSFPSLPCPGAGSRVASRNQTHGREGSATNQSAGAQKRKPVGQRRGGVGADNVAPARTMSPEQSVLCGVSSHFAERDIVRHGDAAADGME